MDRGWMVIESGTLQVVRLESTYSGVWERTERVWARPGEIDVRTEVRGKGRARAHLQASAEEEQGEGGDLRHVPDVGALRGPRAIAKDTHVGEAR